jgi:hypothetical protein
MGTPSVAEMRAAEPRERLEAFVGELVAALPLARQRRNALVDARGLIEHGGRRASSRRSSGSAQAPPSTSRCSSSWPTRLGMRR